MSQSLRTLPSVRESGSSRFTELDNSSQETIFLDLEGGETEGDQPYPLPPFPHTAFIANIDTNTKLDGMQPKSICLTPEESSRHQAGFSPVAFSQYERRLDLSREKRNAAAAQRFSLTSGPDAISAVSLEGTQSPIQPLASLKPVYHAHSWSSGTTLYAEITTEKLQGFPSKKFDPVTRTVRRKWLTVYRRLFSIAFGANVVAMLLLLALKTSGRPSLSDVATAAATNILITVLIRQDYVVNLLFRTCWRVPHSWPLWFRCRIAKIYEHGGIHSGAGVSGALWFALLTALITVDFVQKSLRSVSIITVTYILLTLFIVILTFSYPRFRFMSHNTFEMSHRFAGWSAVGLFWAEIVLLSIHNAQLANVSVGVVLIREPSFWMLAITTAHIILPWLRLRKWTFHPEILSTHALRLNFPHNLPPLSGLAISLSPLKEWHPFATFPTTAESPQGKGSSMIISNAGDWTKANIQSPSTKYWVKGVPKTGVLSMAFVFSRVVIVTTGSGIGPCLSFLREPSQTKTQVRVVWSTPAPLQTYGSDIYNSVLEADPQAVVLDTRVSGRPDLVAVTWALYREFEAEAVFVISNPRVTKNVVYAMESRDVPAFGPVWDS